MPLEYSQTPTTAVENHGTFAARLAPNASAAAQAVNAVRVPTDAWGGVTHSPLLERMCTAFETDMYQWLVRLDEDLALYGAQLRQVAADTRSTEQTIAERIAEVAFPSPLGGLPGGRRQPGPEKLVP